MNKQAYERMVNLSLTKAGNIAAFRPKLRDHLDPIRPAGGYLGRMFGKHNAVPRTFNPVGTGEIFRPQYKSRPNVYGLGAGIGKLFSNPIDPKMLHM